MLPGIGQRSGLGSPIPPYRSGRASAPLVFRDRNNGLGMANTISSSSPQVPQPSSSPHPRSASSLAFHRSPESAIINERSWRPSIRRMEPKESPVARKERPGKRPATQIRDSYKRVEYPVQALKATKKAGSCAPPSRQFHLLNKQAIQSSSANPSIHEETNISKQLGRRGKSSTGILHEAYGKPNSERVKASGGEVASTITWHTKRPVVSRTAVHVPIHIPDVNARPRITFEEKVRMQERRSEVSEVEELNSWNPR